MSFFQAVVLGVVQGLTEFLPISSSGHLVLLSKLPFWPAQPLVFDTSLHLATALVLIVYFRKDLLSILFASIEDFKQKGFDFSGYSYNAKLGFYVIAGSIPTGILGLAFESAFENKFRTVSYVAFFLFLGSLLMFIAQLKGDRPPAGHKKEIKLTTSLKVGIFQALALFPGVSRSGASISGGMLSGLDRVQAARFSFLLSVPIVITAGLYKIITTDWQVSSVDFFQLAVGFISSFVTGFIVIHFFLEYLKNRGLGIFIWYRFVLVILLVFFAAR